MRTIQQKSAEERILQRLASSYLVFTDPRVSRYPVDTWVQHIYTIDCGDGRFHIDGCLDSPEEVLSQKLSKLKNEYTPGELRLPGR